jgi:dipeptidase D
MSHEISGLVETSNNFAIIKITDNSELFINCSPRSSNSSQLEWVSRRIEALGELISAKTERHNFFPTWNPDINSPLLKRFIEVYKKINAHEPVVSAIHAGLECGLIGSKYDNMDMISIGPDLKDVHTPKEKLNIPSTEKVAVLLEEVLKSYK